MQSGQIVVGSAATRVTIRDNTIRDSGPSSTAQTLTSLLSLAYNPTTGGVSCTTSVAHNAAIGSQFHLSNLDGTGAFAALNGWWTAAAGTGGTTLNFTAPTGLTLTVTDGRVLAFTLAVALSHIVANTYTADSSGNISLTTDAAHGLLADNSFVLSSMAGSVAAVNLNGLHVATTGTTGTTLNFVALPSTSAVVTGGRVLPANLGISINSPDYCRLAGNRIADYQHPAMMTAALGGAWGQAGVSEGNYYGPRNAIAPDVSVYGNGSVQANSQDALFGVSVVNGNIAGAVTFQGATQQSGATQAYFQSRGLTPGWNYNSGRGEVDFFCGQSTGSPGGFDFLQVAVLKITAGTYDPVTGAVVLTTALAHGLVPGSAFGLSGLSTSTGDDLVRLTGAHTATTGTSGTTINFTDSIGLTIASFSIGVVTPSGAGGGLVNLGVGIFGSLLANDGLGNTRLGGALVHGAMQSATLTAGGTVTVNPNTSLVLVQNASSIATGSVVLPAPQAGSYQLAGSVLDVRFQNAIGTLTVTAAAGAGVAGPPIAVLSGGSTFRFVMSEPGNVWLPCLPDVSGTPPVGGPYLPLSGGGVTGATTFAALTTHAAGLTVSGGTLTAGSTTLTGTVTLPTTTTGPFLPLVGGIHSIAESGAVGDGTTDDQPAIQAWLNTLTNGAEVLLQPGKWYYIHAAPLYVPPHVTIRGAYNVRDNQFAGGGSTLFGAGGFYIDPALPVGIIMAAATTLRSLKVYRVGMTANANNTVAAADYATWTAEGVYKKTTALVGTGITTIPLADTTGISTGMTVTGPGGFSPIGTTWPQYSTVTAINPGVSVTVSVGGNVAIASGAYLRFGKSTGIIVSRNCGGVVIDEVQIIGFRTGIQTFPGEFAISRGFGDCITNLECVTGADNGIIRDCEWLPLYGMPVSTQFVRAGDGVFVHDCAGPAFHDCYSIGWKINWHFENSSCWCYGCGGETPTDAGAGTENWTIRGGAQMSLFNCHAQTGGIGFHLDGSNQFQLVGCSGANAQITTANNTAHVLIENTIGAPVMTGSLIAPWSSSGYPSKVPIKYGSGTISGVTVSDVFMQDIVTPSPTAPFIQGTAPNPLNPGVYPGVVYQGSRVNGGTTAVPQYWHGVVIDSASNPLPTYTVQLPAFPSDRQSIDLWFNVAVTALTYTTTDGAAVGNYHNPAAGDQVQVIYQAGPNKWFVGG